MSDLLKPRRFGLDAGDNPAQNQPKYDDEAFAKKYPYLAEFLQREWWSEDKSLPVNQRARDKGSIILFCEEGMFKACLSDKDAGAVAFISKKVFTGLLEAIEKGLREDTLDWRLSQQGKQRVKK